tara:strand:+ start:205 stop:456 length:252 start_codon:yes stop_codon:yes gene_type:complete
MARLLKASGEILPNVSISTLKEMQELVGGYIEFVYTEKQLVLIVNEEGLIMSLPVNQMASEVADQVIVGDVIEVPELEFQKLA